MYQHKMERAGFVPWDAYIIGACVLLLTGVGLVTLLVSVDGDLSKFHWQLYALALGTVLFVLGCLVNLDMGPDVRKKFIFGFFLFTLVLCLMPFMRFFRMGYAQKLEDAKIFRWITFHGISLQPSEFAKLFLPVYFAHIFDKNKEQSGSFFSTVLPPLLVAGLFVLLVFLQKDYSTAILIGVNALAIFLVAGIKLRYFFAEIVLLGVTSFLAVRRSPRHWARILSQLNPQLDPNGVGYQSSVSKKAIISGGFWGKGIGQGTWDVSRVPEMHSDFIFSSFAAETGFLGVLMFFTVFVVFAILGYRVARREGPLFNQLLVFGLVTMIVSQVLLNIFVTGGFLVATGIPLPFFSHGGSSLIVTLTACGLIVNISRRSARRRDAYSFASEVRNDQ